MMRHPVESELKVLRINERIQFTSFSVGSRLAARARPAIALSISAGAYQRLRRTGAPGISSRSMTAWAAWVWRIFNIHTTSRG